jgi:uncharacterized membrane-anchored protein YitT (DUF2179 family)
MIKAETKKVLVVLFGALLNAVGLNLFLIPANVYASGFTGISQLLSSVIAEYTPFYVSTGILLLLLNIPVAILGWLKVGKSFTFYSFFSVAATSLFLGLIPLESLSEDIT